MQRRVLQAWIFLCIALAVHVADEALNGFLSVYNPTVLALRETKPWLPFPVFEFKVWLGGLITAVILLLAMSRAVARGATWARVVATLFAVLMLANAAGHTAGTILGRTVRAVRFDGPMPGFYSSPLLAAASIYVLVMLARTRATLGADAAQAHLRP